MKIEFISWSIMLVLLIIVTIIDIKTKRIPDVIVFPGMVITFVIKLFLEKQSIVSLTLLVIGGFLPFFLIWYLTKGKMGLGDAKLSSFLALALGLQAWLLMLFLSSLSAIVFAVFMMLRKKIDKKTQIPYAPFLSLGAVLSLCLTYWEIL